MNRLFALLSMIFVTSLLSARTADSLVFHLWPNGAPESNGLAGPEVQPDGGRVTNVTDATLTVYPGYYPNGTAIIACPGGGYVRLAMSHEGYDMAEWMNKMGITFAVLKYRMPNGHAGVPLADAMQAMRIMRQHAAEWGVTRIGIMGASAGGHLASTLATHYTADTKPDFQVLLYPVTDMQCHHGSTQQLLGDHPSQELLRLYDNAAHVDSLTPPAFIVMSGDDHVVGLKSPLAYYSALVDHGVPAELHIYPDGGHGWGFKNDFKWKQDWTTELADWLRQLGTKRGNKGETDVQRMSWRRVSRFMPESFYASKEAQDIATRIIYYQAPSGGWAKNINYHFNYTPEQMAELKKSLNGPTIDNESTTQEMKFLAHVYRYKAQSNWRKAFIHAVEYLLNAQYANGGWPQYWPKKNIDNGLDYSTHITYNDNAMVNVMDVLKAIAENNAFYAPLKLDKKLRERCQAAFDKGVECILNTQIIVDGKPTVWCAQHDEQTLQPASARAYELPSFSGAESVGIVQLLMNIDHPSQRVIDAVKGAVAFFRSHEIRNIATEHFRNAQGMNDMRVVPSEGNILWARFYDLSTQKPFFCGRDGVKHSSVYDIERERRAGYGWYTNAPAAVLKAYPAWLKKVGTAE